MKDGHISEANFTLRLPHRLRRALETNARRNGRSLGGELRMAATTWLDTATAQPQDPAPAARNERRPPGEAGAEDDSRRAEAGRRE